MVQVREVELHDHFPKLHTLFPTYMQKDNTKAELAMHLPGNL